MGGQMINFEKGIIGLFVVFKWLFLVFLGLCAAVVLIKLAFGTLHIHITIDNLDDFFIKKKGANDEKIRYYPSDYIQKAESVWLSESEETPQQAELRRFKEAMRRKGTLSKEEIDKLTYEDVQKYRNE